MHLTDFSSHSDVYICWFNLKHSFQWMVPMIYISLACYHLITNVKSLLNFPSEVTSSTVTRSLDKFVVGGCKFKSQTGRGREMLMYELRTILGDEHATKRSKLTRLYDCTLITTNTYYLQQLPTYAIHVCFPCMLPICATLVCYPRTKISVSNQSHVTVLGVLGNIS